MRNNFAGLLIILSVWFLVTRFSLVDTFFLPSPETVTVKLFELLKTLDFLKDFLATLQRIIISFILASLFGIPLGLILGSYRKIYRHLEFIVDFFRSIPPTAIFPLFLLIFGIGDISKVAVAAFSGSLIVLFNTAYGVINTDPTRKQLALLVGASRFQVVTQISLFEALPGIITGLRNALSLTIIVIVVTEMFIGSSLGLGRRIIDFEIIYDIPAMYATIIMVGIIGYLANFLFSKSESNLLHWARTDQGSTRPA